MKRIALVLLVLSLGGCHDVRPHRRRRPREVGAAGVTRRVRQSRAGLARARKRAGWGAAAACRRRRSSRHRQADWAFWRVHLDANPPIDATWAIRSVTQSDGALSLVPHRPLADARRCVGVRSRSNGPRSTRARCARRRARHCERGYRRVRRDCAGHRHRGCAAAGRDRARRRMAACAPLRRSGTRRRRARRSAAGALVHRLGRDQRRRPEGRRGEPRLAHGSRAAHRHRRRALSR